MRGMARGGTPEQRAVLAARIRRAREQAGHDHPASGCAAEIGVEKETYYRWEAGAQEPNVFMCHKISRHFNVTVEWLLDEEPDERGMPAPYLEWRETPRARDADPRAFAWIESRSYGHPGSHDYYDSLLYAWERGLRDRDALERAARETEVWRRKSRDV